jgi:nucleoid-associated protein YgaU
LWTLVFVSAASMCPSPVRAESAISHVVRPGDTLASIAERYYGDPRRESVLVAENGLTTEGGSAIVTGLRLIVPTVFYHRVKEGETWIELARKFYGDARRAFVLVEANNGNSGEQPDTGAELLIPYPLRHVTRQNETLRHVSKNYYRGRRKSVEGIRTLRRFNRIRRIRLHRGQIVLVPLDDLVLSEKGREIAREQNARIALGGEVRDKQARIDAELPVLREHVFRGRYADAVSMGSRLLGMGDLTGNQVVTIQRELGVAFVALGRGDLAEAALVEVLQRQPDMELDTVRTSPKVLHALDRARARLMARKSKTRKARKRGAVPAASDATTGSPAAKASPEGSARAEEKKATVKAPDRAPSDAVPKESGGE